MAQRSPCFPGPHGELRQHGTQVRFPRPGGLAHRGSGPRTVLRGRAGTSFRVDAEVSQAWPLRRRCELGRNEAGRACPHLGSLGGFDG